MYAAAKDGQGKPLQIAAQVPDYFKFQTWQFEASGCPDHVRILYIPQEDVAGRDIGGIGFSNASQAPGSPVTLGPLSDYIVEVKAEIDGGFIVTISPTGDMVGMDYYVGVEDNEVVIVGFPIGTTEGLPGWFFRTN
ncbi:hypothetical protein FRC07_006499 [Ceratobasidium sp. 392]|nr:hypothetical protein FRC07_006499 [Ceratobasidium sp. 392]